MRRTVLLYGAGVAAIAALLQYLQYRYLVRALPVEFYVLLIALFFAGLGIWLGIRLTPRSPPHEFERNSRAIASLGLTRRECEVLDHLASGASTKEIARTMGLSPNTVKTHIANLCGKLGVSGRGRAVDMARSLSLLP